MDTQEQEGGIQKIGAFDDEGVAGRNSLKYGTSRIMRVRVSG